MYTLYLYILLEYLNEEVTFPLVWDRKQVLMRYAHGYKRRKLSLFLFVIYLFDFHNEEYLRVALFLFLFVKENFHF